MYKRLKDSFPSIFSFVYFSVASSFVMVLIFSYAKNARLRTGRDSRVLTQTRQARGISSISSDAVEYEAVLFDSHWEVDLIDPL